MSKLYREKIDQLQAAEQRLLEQKAEAQRAARALAEQARRDGDGLVREAQNAVKVLENEAMQRAGEATPSAPAQPYGSRRSSAWTRLSAPSWKRW